MMATGSAVSKTNHNPNRFGFLTAWLQPRSQDRDEAFRERSIRLAIALVISIGLVSALLTIFVFQNEWQFISFPTLHLVVLVGFFAAASTVARQKIQTSATLVVVTTLIAASGYVILTGQTDVSAQFITGIPLFMIAVLVAVLVYPRNLVWYVSVIALVMYSLSMLAPTEGNIEANPNVTQAILSAVLIIPLTTTILYRLRVEFDLRLDAMRLSIRQAEEARQAADEARLQAEADRQRAEEADKAKSQFLANMSHELRTPLNAIIGYDEAMLGGMVGEFSPQQTKLLGHIQYNSRRLLNLINDILDLSKIESGSLQVFFSPMSPHKVIRETVENMRSLADEKGIALTVEFSDVVPEVVLGDPSKLQQIVTNLVGNAIKFTDEGSVSVNVTIADSSNWMLQVRDTGIGMPDDALTTIFEPFHQVDTTDKRKYKGTGLGLAITRRLIEAMGGKIEVTSKLGEGSTFFIVLPRAFVPESAVEAARPFVMEANS